MITKQRQPTMRFARKLLLFSLPILLGLLGLLATALVIGEALPPAYVLSLPNSTSGVYQPIWDRQQQVTYKLQAEIQRAPEVLLLGTSRGLFMRSEMFTHQPEAFYNAAFPAATPHELRQMVEVLAESNRMPNVLLLALDYPHFNADRVAFLREDRSASLGLVRQMNQDQVSEGMRTIGRRWLYDPGTMLYYLRNNLGSPWPQWGLTVWQTDQGFRVDGSHYRGVLQDDAVTAQRVANHEEQLANRENMYEVGQTPDEAQIEAIGAILALAQQYGTRVVGYLPPYQTRFYETLTTHDDYAYIPRTTRRLQQVFAHYGYPLLDLGDLHVTGGQDAEMYDGWHPGVRLMMRILLTLAEAEPETLGAYVDPAALAADIQQADDPFFYYVSGR